MRNMKDSILEEHLIHVSIWIGNDNVMNEEDDESKGSRRSLPTKQINISSELYFPIYLVVYMTFFIYYA